MVRQPSFYESCFLSRIQPHSVKKAEMVRTFILLAALMPSLKGRKRSTRNERSGSDSTKGNTALTYKLSIA